MNPSEKFFRTSEILLFLSRSLYIRKRWHLEAIIVIIVCSCVSWNNLLVLCLLSVLPVKFIHCTRIINSRCLSWSTSQRTWLRQRYIWPIIKEWAFASSFLFCQHFLKAFPLLLTIIGVSTIHWMTILSKLNKWWRITSLNRRLINSNTHRRILQIWGSCISTVKWEFTALIWCCYTLIILLSLFYILRRVRTW